MIDQHDQHVAIFQGGIDIDQLRARISKFHGQLRRMGFDDMDPLAEAARQRGGHQPRRAFAKIVDIGLEGEAEAGNLCAGRGFDKFGRARDGMVNLAVIHPARGADQRRLFGRAMNDEPGIDRDAMSAHARAGLQDVDARMAIGEADHLPHIQTHRIGDDRQFIGKGDVDVAIGVFDQLGHFG